MFVLGRVDEGHAGLAETGAPEQYRAADSSLPAYDAAAAALLTERVLAFLDTVEADRDP